MVESKLTVNVQDVVQKHRQIMAEKIKTIRGIDTDINNLIFSKMSVEKAFDDAGNEMIKDYCKDHGLSFKYVKEIINPSR